MVVADLAMLQRLEAKFTPEPNSGCWLWTGAITADGYGKTAVNRMSRLAHRVFYELVNGAIPSGLMLDHLCRVRCCINPAHLEPVTNRENVLRGTSFTAVNARKTHCNSGHPFAAGNLYLTPTGQRTCRECRNAAVRKYRTRLAERAKGGPS